jgi:hypothetical protein
MNTRVTKLRRAQAAKIALVCHALMSMILDGEDKWGNGFHFGNVRQEQVAVVQKNYQDLIISLG